MNLNHLTTAEDCSVEAEQETDANQDSVERLFLISMLNHKRFNLYVFIYPLQKAKEIEFLEKNSHISAQEIYFAVSLLLH